MNSPHPASSSLPLGSLPAPLVVLLALFALGVAVALHFIRKPASREVGWGLVVVRIAATCVAWWMAVAAASPIAVGFHFLWRLVAGAGGHTADSTRYALTFLTHWPLLLWCILGGLATEGILALYEFERRSVSRGVGGTLAGLRLALLVIVLFWLMQPDWHGEWSTPVDRYIAVLLDGSASMGLIDTEPTARERLDLARLFDIPLPNRPDAFHDTAGQIADLRHRFSSQLKSLELMGSADAGTRLMENRVAELVDLTAAAGRTLDGVDKSLAELGGKILPLNSQDAAAVASLQGQLKGLRDGPFQRLHLLATKSSESAAPNLIALRDDVRGVVDMLDRLGQEIGNLPPKLDEAYWRSLPVAKRAEIEKQTNVARSAIARRVLALKDQDSKKPLVEALRDGYKLKFYRFASQPAQLSTALFLPKEKEQEEPAKREQGPADKAQPGSAPTKTAADAKSATAADKDASHAEEPKLDDPWRSATDYAAALRRAYQDVPKGSDLSEVLILSNGPNNVEDPLQPIATELAAREVPVSTVVIGTRQIPKDAAVAGLDVPNTLLVGDKLSLSARLKIDGYRGQEILAKLFRGTEEIDHKTVKVPEDHHRTRVEFTDLPKLAAIYTYRVELLTATGSPLQESVMVNNSMKRQVTVTDDRIKLLVLESRPRWEFRYLKNLFAGRDKTVFLQYMMTNPDRIGGVSTPPVHVSTSRPYGAFEGTALPENEQEWMKFDVVVLGDVAPTTLDKPTLKSLEKFVGKRGGTLVVIAGPNYMPHAYADTSLSDMLPVRCEKVDGWLGQGPEPGYRFELTAEGKEDPLMKQVESPAENAELWKATPVLRWRHPKTRAKEGANVLAYAESAYGAPPRPSGEASAKEEDQRQRKNALVCWQRFGAGKVLMLTFDQTWRLRYRIGDVYHHRFWGQVLRWATEDKLPAGTNLVRLGTDRSRYSVGQSLTIKARLMDEKADPVLCDDVEARVYRGEKLLDTVPLAREVDMPGRYRADVPKNTPFLHEPSSLRIELGGPSVEKLLAHDTGHKAQIEIVVTDTKSTGELIELTADDAVPTQLAKMTHGRVVAPVDALSLLGAFGRRSGSNPTVMDVPLWDWWPILLLFLVAGSGEWILRKKAGLV